MQSNILIELTITQALTVVILIPVLSVTLTTIMYSLAKQKESRRLGRVAAILTSPIQISPLHLDREEYSSEKGVVTQLKNQLINRYSLLLLLLMLFFIGNLLATFYHVLGDYSINIIDPEFVSGTWTQIIIESPFRSGWYGTLPWYGDRFLPPEGAIVYHETWSWIFFSAGITDDPTFFAGASNIVLIVTILFGLVFLLPLLARPIRNSFSQSLFFFLTGMFVSMRGIFGYFSQAFMLEFNSTVLQYGIRLVFPGQLQVTTEAAIISTFAPVIGLLCIVFVVLGGLLWKKHYPNHRRSHLLFMVYVALSYWLSLYFVMNT